MKRTKSFLILYTILLALSGLQSACLRKSEEAQISVKPPVIGEVEDTGFFIKSCLGKPDEAGFPDAEGGECQETSYLLHKVGDPTSECKVSSVKDSEPWASRNIDCYLEAYELELWKNGHQILMNIPRSQCEYVQFKAYWYWNFAPGYAPATATVNKTDTGGCIDGTVSPPNLGYVDADCEVQCFADHSKGPGSSPEMPNCCYGDTTITVNQIGQAASTSKKEFRGRFGDCVKGPGFEAAPKDPLGIPTPFIFEVGASGLNSAYNVRPTAKALKGIRHSIHASNYISSADHDNGIPVAFSGRAGYRPERNYTVECMDEAMEVKARIRLQVREWDRKEDFDNYKLGSILDVDSDSGSNRGGGIHGFSADNAAQVNLASDEITLSGRTWLSPSTPTPVVLVLDNPGSGHSLPAGLSEGVQYYLNLVSPSAGDDTDQDTVTLSLSPAGTPVVDITALGASGSDVLIFANDVPDLESRKNDFLDWRDFGQNYPRFISGIEE